MACWKKNNMGDFPIETSIHIGFSIAIFDDTGGYDS
jgi:hypothetical protein